MRENFSPFLFFSKPNGKQGGEVLFAFFFFSFFIFSPFLSAADIPLEKNPHVLKILELTGIKHDGSLDRIVELTQKDWLRAKGLERWEIPGERFTEIRPQLMLEFRNLGYLKSTPPHYQRYDGVIVMGGFTPSFRQRLSTLAYLHDQGISFNKVIVLTTERLLDPKQESLPTILKKRAFEYDLKPIFPNEPRHLKTEADVVRFYWTNLQFSSDLANLPLHIFIVPLKIVDGKEVRPPTEDNIKSWLQMDQDVKKGTRYLAISNQPYAGYQGEVVKHQLQAKGVHVETVGYAADENVKIDLLLDSLARHLYQVRENRKAAQG